MDQVSPSTPVSEKAPSFLFKLRVEMMGLVQDFWTDTPFQEKKNKSVAEVFTSGEPLSFEEEAPKKLWAADRIQILETLWTEGCAFPGGDEYVDLLVKPLGLSKEMSVLDLSAKLGSMARKIADDYGTYVTGMEEDQTLVSRGMILSIAAGKGKQAAIESYDPEEFESSKMYDCIFARELLYKVGNKEKFCKAVADSTKKSGGQIVLTDFLLDSSSRSNPAIIEWIQKEGAASPLTLPETLKIWKDLRFDMRVAEDQTEFYETEMAKGFARLLGFVKKNEPDERTKLLIAKEMDFWAHRLDAIKHGMKYYRFYGIKY